MALKCGMVGLPNVGKSTLFNALTENHAPAENYPFCTIEPNVGTVTVADPRLDDIAALVKPEQVIPTTMQFVDIAGLVKGASQGEGLGNQFLANIRETDAILHIVRCFEDDDVIHVNNAVSPIDDIEVINTELMLADLQSAENMKTKLQKKIKARDEAAQAECEVIEKAIDVLNQGDMLNQGTWSDEEHALLQSRHFLTYKPVLYVLNTHEESQEIADKVTSYVESKGAGAIQLCATLEAEISGLDKASKQEFLQAYGKTRSGLEDVTHASYQLLGLGTFFTAGPKEVRAWTYKRGSLAPAAAGVIHTDFERGFIRAEVTAFDDFIAHQGEAGAKAAGKLRLEGKDYLVQDGDIMHFRFNV